MVQIRGVTESENLTGRYYRYIYKMEILSWC